MSDQYTSYLIQYSYGREIIPVETHIFDDGRNEIFVSSEKELFKTILHRKALYLDKTNAEHYFEEIGQQPVLFSCFSDQRCANFLKGLLNTILSDYQIGLRLLQVSHT